MMFLKPNVPGLVNKEDNLLRRRRLYGFAKCNPDPSQRAEPRGIRSPASLAATAP